MTTWGKIDQSPFFRVAHESASVSTIRNGKRTVMTDGRDPRSMLLVVDVQNGFVNEHTRHVIEPINRLIGAFSGRGVPVAFTRFVNTPDSGYQRWIGWTRFMRGPENDLYDVWRLVVIACGNV